MSDQESRDANVRPATRLGWRERRKVRRSAIRVAGRGEPSLDLNDRPVTTQERETFFDERNNSLGELRLSLIDRLAGDLELLGANRRRLQHLRNQLAGLRTAPEPPVAPARENLRTDERIVATRAARRSRQAAGRAQARVSSTTTEIAQLTKKNAALLARLDAFSERWEAQKRAVHHSTVLKRALFDENLTRHHRFRGVLELRLDRQIPPIPRDLDVRLLPPYDVSTEESA